ncbi:endonuclease/exonuclease/phosphatase family protein [Rhodococcus sp. ZPP]|uniref:endonuclease/exonuclease/phosphatase family protein n=1 Tax=Rhodococcus sp. ZPP TaxID=2749906 RepID=UPI001AD8574C|nr:endonuclease/exonuclease/phosphatase family protein [Rhodococcus sp. ZPP]QTJ68634.1 endonuclease/exonuclease/phosphatase family protein [Rhodococcus sp. ZPP]
MPENNPTAIALNPNIMAILTAVDNAAELRKALDGLGPALASLAWLGEPASAAESTNNIGGKYRHFTNGILYRYTHDDGTKAFGGVPRGGVYELWTKTGWEYGPFGYPVGMPELAGNKTVCRFEGGTITSVAESRHSIMFYNTALIGMDVLGVTENRATLEIPLFGKVIDKAIYSGRGRAAQLKALIATVSKSKNDVVVLAEMMGNHERDKLKTAVKNLFPHSAEGPDEKDPEEDGGLLILSRHPITEVRSTIYRSCIGDDCFANKGAVMVRVSPHDGPDFYVLGTHLQAGNATSGSWPTDAGVGTGANGKREAQLRHLDSWILGARDRDLPIIIVGDFNIDANTQEGRATLAHNLPETKDLWPEYQMWLPTDRTRYDPITCDRASTYRPGTPALPQMSPHRYKKGGRIDLALVDQGERVTAHVTHMGVYSHELSPGIDLSDHYAITLSVGMSTVTHKLNRKVKKTTAWLKYIHALTLTDGAGVAHFSKKDPDEVEVSGRIYKGKPGLDGRPSARVEYAERTMSMGERHEYSYKPQKTLSFNGTDDVHLEITLDEVDTAGPIETGRTAIGRDRDVVASKTSQLLNALHGHRYAPNVMHGDGSEYVAILYANVDLEPFAHRRQNPAP